MLRKGCRIANAGEFTLRAFLNGKMDLSQVPDNKTRKDRIFETYKIGNLLHR